MPRKRKWLILDDFEWMPRKNVLIAFRRGEIHFGLTIACRQKAGARIQEIRD